MARTRQHKRSKTRRFVVAILVSLCCFAYGVPASVWGPIATAALGGLATLGYKAADTYCSPESMLVREFRRSYPPVVATDLVDYEVDVINATLHQETGFSLVIGPHHCGKTAYVSKKLCEIAAEGRCVRYATPERSETAFKVVHKAIFGYRRNFAERWRAKFFSEPTLPIDLSQLAPLLKKVAAKRNKKDLLAPVLVIDELGVMSKEGGEDLVRFAKCLADTRAMNVVLMTSPGQLAIHLLRTTAMSRGELILMPDPPKKAVQEALHMRLETLKKHISPNHIDLVYNLTGGRWEDIDEVYFFMKRNEKFDFEIYKGSRFKAMETKVSSAAILAHMDEKFVLAFLQRVRKDQRVELTVPSVTDDENKIALALVDVTLLKTVMCKAGAVEVELHGMIVQQFVDWLR